MTSNSTLKWCEAQIDIDEPFTVHLTFLVRISCYLFCFVCQGLRRRRMPYFGVTAPFGSTNPWHRQNGFFSAPTDFFISKPPNPLLAVRNPAYFDFGRLRGRETLLPYGGYSSFTPHHGPLPTAGFYHRPFYAFRSGWRPPMFDATGSGYSGEGPRSVHDGLNTFYASPYSGWSGGGGRFGFGMRQHCTTCELTCPEFLVCK